MLKQKLDNIFFILFLILPLTIIVGPSVSLINIFLIILLYFYNFFNYKHYKFLFYNNTLKLLIILNFYLIVNSIISLNYEIGILRNLGFVRFIFIFIAINYFFYEQEKKNNLFNFWTLIFIIFVFDVYFERFSGSNIFGWGAKEIDGIIQADFKRIVSFFKDEPVAGAYLNGLAFLISGYLLSKLKDNKLSNILIFLLIFIFFVSIILTGERSNTIKAFFGITLFILILDNFKIKHKIFFFIFLLASITFVIYNSNYLKNRYVGQLFYYFLEKDSKSIEDSSYYKLYKSGYNVFKNYPLLGVGNKNYRLESCKDSPEAKKYDYKCNTHPHQLYFEFLSEHGLIGTIILLVIFFVLIFKNLNEIIKSRNYVQMGSFVYLIAIFLPLIPSGSFFSDFNITLFFLNFSLMYAINKDTNIFFTKKDKKN
tara:strand:+ start:18 stop:1292 length:1275 start_codon:yes stop_codon:yes gene_type:complete